MKYIKNKKDLNEFLSYEARRYDMKNKRYPLIAIREKEILYKINYLLRKTEYYNNTNKKIIKNIFRLRLRLIQNKYLIFLPLNVFDKGLKLIHIGPRIINGNAKIGKDCTLHVNTSVVAGGTERGGFPILNDNIVMGIGSCIAGDVIIGNNTAIGANAFVNKSFEEGNMTIAGVPAKKISDNTTLNWG